MRPYKAVSVMAPRAVRPRAAACGAGIVVLFAIFIGHGGAVLARCRAVHRHARRRRATAIACCWRAPSTPPGTGSTATRSSATSVRGNLRGQFHFMIGGVAFPQRIRTPTGRLDLLAGVQQPETGGDQAGRRATAARPHARDRAAETMVGRDGIEPPTPGFSDLGVIETIDHHRSQLSI